MSRSCLGRACTVQHRNPDCRGGKNAKERTDELFDKALQNEIDRLKAIINGTDADLLDKWLAEDGPEAHAVHLAGVKHEQELSALEVERDEALKQAQIARDNAVASKRRELAMRDKYAKHMDGKTRQENIALKRKTTHWQRAAEALEAAMDYQDMDWRDPVLQNDLDRDAMELLQIAREAK